MRPKKLNWIFSVILILSTQAGWCAQNPENYTFTVSQDFAQALHTKIRFYNTHGEIQASKNNQISVEISLDIQAKDQAEVDKYIKLLKSELLKVNETEASVNYDVYQNMSSQNVNGVNQVKLTTKVGKINLDHLEIRYIKVFVPLKSTLHIDSHFSDIELTYSPTQKINLNFYDSEIHGINCKDSLLIAAHFSKLNFEKLSHCKVNLYESELKAASAQNIDMHTKFSDIHIPRIENALLYSYEDSYNIQDMKNLSVQSKFGHYKLGKAEQINANMYEDKLSCNTANDFKLSDKFGEYKFGEVKTVTLTQVYESEIEIEKTERFRASNSRFSDIDIAQLTQSIHCSGYEDKITVHRMGTDFKAARFEGKFLKIELGMPQSTAYQLSGEVQFPNFNIAGNYTRKVHEMKASKLIFDYVAGKEPYHPIQLSGYEIQLTLAAP